MFQDPMLYVVTISTLLLVVVVQGVGLRVLRALESFRAAATEGTTTQRDLANDKQRRIETRFDAVEALFGKLERSQRTGVVLVVGAWRKPSGEPVQFIAGCRVEMNERFGPNELSAEAMIGPVQYDLEPGTLLIAIGPCVLEALAVGGEFCAPWANRNETPIAVIGNPIRVGSEIRARVRWLPW